MNFPIQKTDEEWRAILAEKGAEPGAFDITRRARTERPFTPSPTSPTRAWA